MQIQINTDHNIKGSEQLNLHLQQSVEASLGRFDERLTRVVIHLSDDNGDKSSGDDKRCLMEARPAGMQPIVVTHIAGTVDDAVDGALDKMTRVLDETFAKLRDPRGRPSLGEGAQA
ncbi:HPF/RaiA family ribosome-associated protein [soil metagenome]